MASAQCCRPACEQNHNHQSLSQKVADMTSRAFKRDGAMHNNKPHGQSHVTTGTHSTIESSSKHHSQLGQKVADMTNRAFKRDGAMHNNNQAHGQTVTTSTHSTTESSSISISKTKTHFGSNTAATNGHGASTGKAQCTAGVHHAKTGTATATTGTTGNGGCAMMTCQEKKSNRREHKKRGLLERIKDGISGHSEESSSSSSSSESDSDDDNKNKNKCGTKKA